MADKFEEITQETFDIRTVIERVEELESDIENVTEDETYIKLCDLTLEEMKAEFSQIEKFLEEVKGNGGDEQWRGYWYPITFIQEGQPFTDYIEELIKDCEGLPRQLPSYIAIDWETTAENCRVDYTSVEIDGETYWYR